MNSRPGTTPLVQVTQSALAVVQYCRPSPAAQGQEGVYTGRCGPGFHTHTHTKRLASWREPTRPNKQGSCTCQARARRRAYHAHLGSSCGKVHSRRAGCQTPDRLARNCSTCRSTWFGTCGAWRLAAYNGARSGLSCFGPTASILILACQPLQLSGRTMQTYCSQHLKCICCSSHQLQGSGRAICCEAAPDRQWMHHHCSQCSCEQGQS